MLVIRFSHERMNVMRQICGYPIIKEVVTE